MPIEVHEFILCIKSGTALKLYAWSNLKFLFFRNIGFSAGMSLFKRKIVKSQIGFSTPGIFKFYNSLSLKFFSRKNIKLRINQVMVFIQGIGFHSGIKQGVHCGIFSNRNFVGIRSYKCIGYTDIGNSADIQILLFNIV